MKQYLVINSTKMIMKDFKENIGGDMIIQTNNLALLTFRQLRKFGSLNSGHI